MIPSDDGCPKLKVHLHPSGQRDPAQEGPAGPLYFFAFQLKTAPKYLKDSSQDTQRSLEMPSDFWAKPKGWMLFSFSFKSPRKGCP